LQPFTYLKKLQAKKAALEGSKTGKINKEQDLVDQDIEDVKVEIALVKSWKNNSWFKGQIRAYYKKNCDGRIYRKRDIKYIKSDVKRISRTCVWKIKNISTEKSWNNTVNAYRRNLNHPSYRTKNYANHKKAWRKELTKYKYLLQPLTYLKKLQAKKAKLESQKTGKINKEQDLIDQDIEDVKVAIALVKSWKNNSWFKGQIRAYYGKVCDGRIYRKRVYKYRKALNRRVSKKCRMVIRPATEKSWNNSLKSYLGNINHTAYRHKRYDGHKLSWRREVLKYKYLLRPWTFLRDLEN